MSARASVTQPEYDDYREQPGFEARRARVGRQAGAEQLGVSVWEVPPGQAAYPYHWHHAEEEVVVVLEGGPSLRTPEGWRELEQGEVVAFPVGEDGAHQLVNRTDATIRFLSISTMPRAEVVHYPDSGKIGAYGNRLTRDVRKTFRGGDDVDYYDGEEPPE
jgi:uncharacterized cupin superfamily protein